MSLLASLQPRNPTLTPTSIDVLHPFFDGPAAMNDAEVALVEATLAAVFLAVSVIALVAALAGASNDAVGAPHHADSPNGSRRSMTSSFRPK